MEAPTWEAISTTVGGRKIDGECPFEDHLRVRHGGRMLTGARDYDPTVGSPSTAE